MLKTFIKYFIIFTLCVTQFSCGFKPIHKIGDTNAIIPPIHIMPINSVEGSLLYEALTQLIGNDEGSEYQLITSLSYTSSNLAITQNSNVIEERITQSVSYKLVDGNQRTIVSGSFQSLGDCNALFGAYVSYNIQRQTKENLARMAATEVQSRLAIYFNKTRHCEETRPKPSLRAAKLRGKPA